MNDRRDFLKTTAVAASLIALSSVPNSFAANKSEYTNIHQRKSRPMEGKRGPSCPKGDGNWFKSFGGYQSSDVKRTLYCPAYTCS